MITSSLNKIAYVTYVTSLEGNVIEDNDGRYVFEIIDTEEVQAAVEIYNKAVSSQEELCVNLCKYNRIVHLYKNKIKVYKMIKSREDHYYKIDKICDKIINKLEK